MKKILLSSLVSVVLSTTVMAENDYVKLEGTSVGGQIGIFGLGLNAKAKFNDNFGIRASFDKYTQDDIDIDVDDDSGVEVNYNFDVDLNDIMLVADYHPWAGSFKLVGGMIINGSELDGIITPKDSSNVAYEFNGHTYTVSDIGSINTTVDWDPVAPYLGIGWDTSFDKDKGWGFTFDAGIAFQGSATAEYSVNYGEGLTINETDTEIEKEVKQELRDQIKSDLDEEMVKLQDDLDDYSVLPYISLGVNYKF